jgi:hypothetical protein
VEAAADGPRRSVSGPIDRGYFTSLYFADPDGQILEIATAGPGYAIDEPADALGRELVDPPSERLPDGRDEEAIARATHPEPVPRVTPDMALDGIHHITGITDDLEDARTRFYQEALGLELVKKTYNQDDAKTRHYFWANYDGEKVAPHSAFTLFDWKGSTYMPGRAPARPTTSRSGPATPKIRRRGGSTCSRSVSR